MGIPVLVLGESGSGKSASLRNFSPDEVGIFNVANKPLPFRKKLPTAACRDYKKIRAGLIKSNKKTFVIDDSQYLMVFEMFDRAKETGYTKFTDMAQNFYLLIKTIIDVLDADKIVYFLHHTTLSPDGKFRAKTSGKMLDDQLTLEGLFSIVLLAQTDGTEHYFLTQNDGFSTVKTPMEMFEETKIDNDLKLVDSTIRAYYEL